MYFPVALGVLALVSGLKIAPSRPIDPPLKIPTPGAHRLTQAVTALRTMHQLRLSPAQLQVLVKLAPETMAKDRVHKKIMISDDYRTLLTDLRKAFIEADDDERISELEEKVADQIESETPEVDDSFDVTDAARKRVPEVYKLLKPPQLVVYFSKQSEEILDPLDELIAAMENVRELKPEEWKASVEELAEELGWLVGGLNSEKNEKVYEGIVALLGKIRELTDDEFKEKRPALEQKARKMIGDLDPSDVLRHHLQRTLTDLLSNPRLEEVLKARLEPEK